MRIESQVYPKEFCRSAKEETLEKQKVLLHSKSRGLNTNFIVCFRYPASKISCLSRHLQQMEHKERKRVCATIESSALFYRRLYCCAFSYPLSMRHLL